MQASQASAEATTLELRQQIGGHSIELVRTQQQLQALSRQYSAAAYQLQHTGVRACPVCIPMRSGSKKPLWDDQSPVSIFALQSRATLPPMSNETSPA